MGNGKWAKGTANKQLQTDSKFRISLHTENQAKDAREFVGSRDALNRLQLLQQALNASSSDLRSLHVAHCMLHVGRTVAQQVASLLKQMGSSSASVDERCEILWLSTDNRQHRQQVQSISPARKRSKRLPFHRVPPCASLHPVGCIVGANYVPDADAGN